ncbi:MAG: S-layer homology domain-containing protein [Clostridia bacterium]|nr:S-layer homology domain-containing protein [Clostridia bacterium]
MKRILLLIFIFAFAFAITAFAQSKISPAIDIIANENSMVKAGVLYNGEFGFDVNDFDEALGVNVKSITISALPDSAVGRLMLDNLYVVENQVIYRDDFSMLRFVQVTPDESCAVFKFKPNESTYEIECSLKSLEIVNLSPVATNGESVSAWTGENISNYGALRGFDPEGDELRYEIVSYPEKGLIQIKNTSTGDYIYTPYEGEVGTDVFSYRVRDSFGNYSETCTVKMKIEKTRTSLVFSDLEDDRYLYAGIILHENDIMTFEENKDGSFSFKPNEEITREEFVVLIMNAMGAKNVPTVGKTRFADDTEIKPEYKGYLECAFSLGIIEGEKESDGVHINPKNSVSTAEGAVIINKIIGAKLQASMTVFADEDDIPDWARSAIASLTELGILTKTDGKISPNAPLTRAQTAQILMSLMSYVGKLGNK